LNDYEKGDIKNKPDVLKQIEEIKGRRENMIKEETQKQQLMQLFSNPQILQSKLLELTIENTRLKEKITYLEDKIKQIITSQIQQKNNV
jgi:predicted nuclease with TOPRIM domain